MATEGSAEYKLIVIGPRMQAIAAYVQDHPGTVIQDMVRAMRGKKTDGSISSAISNCIRHGLIEPRHCEDSGCATPKWNHKHLFVKQPAKG